MVRLKKKKKKKKKKNTPQKETKLPPIKTWRYFHGQVPNTTGSTFLLSLFRLIYLESTHQKDWYNQIGAN